MNRQELEKIVRPLDWAVYNNGRYIRADTDVAYDFRLEKVGEQYLVQVEYSVDNARLEYDKPVSLEAAKEIAWAKYLHTISCILKDPSEDE